MPQCFQHFSIIILLFTKILHSFNLIFTNILHSFNLIFTKILHSFNLIYLKPYAAYLLSLGKGNIQNSNTSTIYVFPSNNLIIYDVLIFRGFVVLHCVLILKPDANNVAYNIIISAK